MSLRLFLILVFALALSACSETSLLTKHDYQRSQTDLMRGEVNDARLDLPKRAERGTFITTMEHTYLGLIQGKADIASLQLQAKALEDRVRYHVSREAKTFFYLQTPEDYYASEHEVIWLHFLLGWGYALKGDNENACVEARIAGSLLSLPWSPNGHFDDPAMRLFLADLWTMCGDWQEARVDLRAAWALDNSLAWAKELANHEFAPAHLFIVLGGPGPDVEWAPEMTLNPLRSERKVIFRLRGQKSPLTISDRSGKQIAAHLSPDASNWYARHVARESELHEVILDSAYGGNAAISSAIATAKITASTGLGFGIAVGGTALGAGILYLGAKGNSGDVAAAGVALIGASLKKGWEITQDGYEDSTSELKQSLDPSENYRFVRFLPEYLWMGWSDQPITFPVTLQTPLSATLIQQPSVLNGAQTVSIGYLPDARFNR